MSARRVGQNVKGKNMWRVTVIFNTILMFIFWGVSTGVIGIAYNRFVRYSQSDTAIALPNLTAIIFSIHPYFVILPLTWTALSIATYRYVRNKPIEIRNECLLSFSLATQSICAVILFVYLIAGTLPFMLIGNPIE